MQADQLEIIYYTDPLCCWSWAMEPQWRLLLYTLRGKVSYHYCMGGLIPDWNNYNDENNSVSRPAQMGPLWMQAKHISGMPLNDRIWIGDFPASSYPACIAVKCAEIQSPASGEKYLRLLREAVMISGLNIGHHDNLLRIANEMSKRGMLNFDINLFENDLKNRKGATAFRRDLDEIKLQGITRFPTLFIRYKNLTPIIITGYRPYAVLRDAVSHLESSLFTNVKPIVEEEYKLYWGSVTDREWEEAGKQAIPAAT